MFSSGPENIQNTERSMGRQNADTQRVRSPKRSKNRRKESPNGIQKVRSSRLRRQRHSKPGRLTTFAKCSWLTRIRYMSRDYIALNTTYIFLNRNAFPKKLRKALNK